MFTSMFLSVGFSQYMISSGALMIIGFMCENKKMSMLRMALLYFGVGMMANLFAACVEEDLSVGQLPAIMGLVSAMLGMVVVNWKVLASAGMLRICLIFMLVFLFVIVLILSASPPAIYPYFKSVSMAAEGGGFMAGIGMGMMLMPYALERESPYVSMVRKIGAGLTLLYCAILIPVFFTAVEPKKVFFY